MKSFLKKYWDIIFLSILLSIIVILNARPNFVVMGLDNSSPYFGLEILLNRIKGTSSIIYGGILFQAPLLFTLSKIGLSPALISNTYIFLNLITGVVGTYLITTDLTEKKAVRVISTLVLLTSLITVWIFSQPNFLFIAAYGSIPILIYLLGKRDKKVLHLVFLAIFSISFLTTSLNLVAFALFLIQIIILVRILYPKQTVKTLLLWTLALLLFWLISLQITKAVNGDYTFLGSNIFNYIQNLLGNTTVTETSAGIIESEKTNSIIHTLAFSLGWTELHNSKNVPIFEFYQIYRENIIYLLLGTIPTLIALFTILKKKSRRIFFLTAVLILSIFLSSRYGTMIIERIPYLSDALRWISSKIWPLFIIPIISLCTIFLDNISKFKNNVLKYSTFILFLLILTFFSFPILSGNLLSSQTLVQIPEVYFELPKESRILVLPEPQALYMREYDWGYYGSDFLSYINSSIFVDRANLYEKGSEYNQILNSNEVPNDIEYVLYDNTVESSDLYVEFLSDFKIFKSNSYYTLYER
jgi:hypothetical protein